MLSNFVHLFLPHHSNNHKPKILHHQSLLFLTGLLLFAHAGLNFLQIKAPNILGYSSQIPPQKIVELTNQRRAALGLSQLTVDDRLSDAARRKAADMFNKNYWAHNAPDGTKPWSFVLAAGYSYLHAGENLARDFTNPENVVDAWMNSPSHRDNLLNSRYQNIGVAVVDGQLTGTETTLVVQMFGTPQQAAPKVTQESNSVVAPVMAAQTPQEEVQEVKDEVKEEVLVQVTPIPTPIAIEEATPVISTFQASKAISSAFILLIVLVLIIDWLVAWQKNLIRLSGRNWAHLTYLGFVAILVIIIKQGLIL